MGTVLGGGLGYLFQVIVARYLGAAPYGHFTLAAACFNMAAMVGVMGMGQTVIRYVALYRGTGDLQRVKGTVQLTISISLVASLAVSLALFTLSPLLAAHVFRASSLTPVLRSMALVIPFNAVTVVLLAATQALRIMAYRVWVKQVFEMLWRIGWVLLLFFLGRKLAGAVTAYATSIVAGTLLTLLLYRRAFRPVLISGTRAVLDPRPLLAFAWPLFVSQGLYALEVWIPVFALGHLAASEAVGIFSAAYRTALLVQAVVASFNPIFAPIIADLVHQGENTRLENLLKTVAKWVFSLCLPILLLVAVFSHEVLALFGPGFERATATLLVLCAGQLVSCSIGPLGVMVSMSGRSRLTLMNTLFYLGLQLVLCFLLIPPLGVLGAALSAAVSTAALSIAQLGEVVLVLRMHPFRTAFLKPLVAGGTACLVSILLRAPLLAVGSPLVRLALGAALFLAVDASILVILGFDPDDRLILSRIRARLAF